MLQDKIKRLDEIDITAIAGFEGGNPKRRTQRDHDILDASLKEHGYVLPVAVFEPEPGKFQLIDGHGRIDRIRASHPDQLRIKALVLDVASVAEGRRLLLALKHTAEWDFTQLEGFVKDALEDGASVESIMATSGLTAADLDILGSAGEAFLDQLEVPPPAEEHAPSSPMPPTGTQRGMKVEVFDEDAVAAATFEHYRATGFPYPDPPPFECMLEINRLASMSSDQLIKTTVGYGVADKFQRHRFAASAEKKLSPLQSFEDDSQLKRAIDLSLKYEGSLTEGAIRGVISLVKNTQACSNFRPGFAAYMYRRFCPPGGTVLDTSTGYGGRLVGALASTVVAHYIGIDPNTPTVEGNRKLLRMLGREDFATLIESPAEDVPNKAFAEQCDFMFTSPPYFRKEHYSDADTQSWKRYPEADAWREKFLLEMLALTFASLKPGAHAAINIGDVLLDNVRHPLGEWTLACAARVGFSHVATLDFPMSRRFGANQKEEIASEPVYVFKKVLPP